MPSGAAVIRYDGKRGVVWKVKYVDADGKQVKETAGRAADGWTKRKAEALLRTRLVEVERDGRRRVEPTTFATFAATWLDEVEPELKRSTIEGYRGIVRRHLEPAFGPKRLDGIGARELAAYVAAKRRAGFAPRTLNRHLNLLNALLGSAVRRKLLGENPVPNVQRPREPRRRWRILTPSEVGAVERAFGELIGSAEGEERAWRQQTAVIFKVAIGTGLRRGELLGLRWRDVALADPDGARLCVRETWVRAGMDTPKSEAGERTIALGPRLAAALFEHRARTAYGGDDQRVFCSPTKGTPFDVARYAATYRMALAKAKIEGHVRPFHDVRHSSITNAAAAGTSPMALMGRAGHSDFKTTQAYIDLAGETFRPEAELLERRLFGPVPESGTKSSDEALDAEG